MLNVPTGQIEVDGLAKAFGDTRVLSGVDLHVAPHSVVVLLGPSGCGKTTLLRTIAGLERADEGRITVSGTPVAGPGLHVPPERRRIGMVFQDWALFPHLDVAGNVGYGLPRRERTAERIEAALELVGLGGMADRRPGTLSGGQQQRVALARAIAPEPSVLLLDEPFSNLDTALRVQVRSELHELLVRLGITTVFVTHDQEEAFVLGDQVAVMAEGRIVQQDTPADLYARPVSPWVARFVGDANLLSAEVKGGVATTSIGAVEVERPDGSATVMVRPEDIDISAGGGARVDLVEYYGHDTVYLVQVDGTTVKVRQPGSPTHGRDDDVSLTPRAKTAIAY